MDSDELKKQSDQYVQTLLKTLKPLKITSSSDDAYSATKEVKQQYEANLERREKEQQLGHRDQLMGVICFLAIGSFLFLALIIIIQMSIRYHDQPNYVGVSDDVIKVMAVSVFGQVIAVVGTLSYHIFKHHT